MKQHRQKILLVALIAIALGAGYGPIKAFVMEPIETRQREKERLQKDIAKRKNDVNRAQRAIKRLPAFDRQSLPSEPQVARSVYQAWLLEAARRAGLKSPSVDSTQPGNFRGVCQSIAFSLQARGTLNQWTAFLFEFYRAGHLHQLRSLSFSPGNNREVLDLSLSIEALILPGADRTDRLSDEASSRLAFDALAEYGIIAKRNLFNVGKTNIDPAEQTFLTGVNRVDGVPEAWFTLRAEKDPRRTVVKLRKGAAFEFGGLRGTILDISDNDVILDLGGAHWLMTVGENVAGAFALPPER
jgi:hypothetical protein